MVGLKKARLNKGNTNTLFDAYSEEEYEYDLAGNPYRYRVGSSAWNTVSSNKNNQTTQIDYASDAVLPVRGKASASATLNVSVDGVQQAYTRPNQEEFAIGLNAYSATKKYQEVRVEAVDTDNGNTIRTMQRGKAYVEATPESFTYDVNGNLLSDGRWNYTWDAENRLVEVETNLSAASAGVKQEKYVYVYDWTGRKIKSECYEYDGDAWVLVSTNKRYYDDYNLIYEATEYADGSSSEVRKYYYGTDLLGSVYGSAGTGGLRMMSINAEDLFVFNDQVGSVEALFGAETNTAAQARAEYVYSAYGEVMMKSGDLADKNNIGYSTRYREGNTGLVGYTYRHYSPGLKKWLSKDPIAEQGGLNLYQMVGNDPVGYWDLLGYTDCKIDVIIGHGAQDTPLGDVGKEIENRINANNSAGAKKLTTSQYKILGACCYSANTNKLAGNYSPNMIPPDKNEKNYEDYRMPSDYEEYFLCTHSTIMGKKRHIAGGPMQKDIYSRLIDAKKASETMCKDADACCETVNINITVLKSKHDKCIKIYVDNVIKKKKIETNKTC